ncbi:MAG: hypothetical protein ACOVOR_04295 [Rhabdochlamydiaceae bacterium]
MKNKQTLTTEKLKSLFSSNFDLANYAIQVGRQIVKSGKELSAENILDEIFKHNKEI